MMYSIGEFSKITGITVKALRHYHSIALLEPGRVEPETGYRFYGPFDVEKARAIQYLRGLSFSLEEIAEVLKGCKDDTDAIHYLLQKRSALETETQRLSDIAGEIDRLIRAEKEAKAMAQASQFVVEEKWVEPLFVASVRWKGTYDETGKAFGKLGKHAGRYTCGPAMNLYYDSEYKEADADVESCFPIQDKAEIKGVEVRTLPGGRCVSLVHQGPYEQMGRSYEKIMQYVKSNRLKTHVPSREIYLKGPGMIFKGNPHKYLTEIQMLIAD
jgi:DNA-binding transcriptional MerR regulator